jgi:hypothetical protein
MQMYSEADVDTSCLGDRQVTILGYGSQGRAHALNLKDSGFNVVVGLRAGGASWPKAEADGLVVKEPYRLLMMQPRGCEQDQKQWVLQELPSIPPQRQWQKKEMRRWCSF